MAVGVRVVTRLRRQGVSHEDAGLCTGLPGLGLGLHITRFGDPSTVLFPARLGKPKAAPPGPKK